MLGSALEREGLIFCKTHAKMGNVIQSATWYGAKLDSCDVRGNYLPWTSGMPVFPVAHSSWIFSQKNLFKRIWKCGVLTSESCEVSTFLLSPLFGSHMAIYLNENQIVDRKVVWLTNICNLYSELCILFVLNTRKHCKQSNKFIIIHRFIDPPPVCQKNQNMNTHASDIVGKAGCGLLIKSEKEEKLLRQRRRRCI